MEKGEIRLRKVIVHILDSTVGVPVLSDALLDYGSDFGDFLREHIYRVETLAADIQLSPSISSSTGQWSEPKICVWIFASFSLSFKSSDTTK